MVTPLYPTYLVGLPLAFFIPSTFVPVPGSIPVNVSASLPPKIPGHSYLNIMKSPSLAVIGTDGPVGILPRDVI